MIICPHFLFAAQPADIESETLIKVQVASDEEVVMVNLSCQIQPSQQKQSYRVMWKRFYEGKFVILSTELFNISLNLTQQNDSNAIYSCDVTVSHDGRQSGTYPGGRFRILITTDNGRGISTTRLWACVKVVSLEIPKKVRTTPGTENSLLRAVFHNRTKVKSHKLGSSPTGGP